MIDGLWSARGELGDTVAEGVAKDAKSGAVLSDGGDGIIFLRDYPAWGDEHLDHVVRVTGRLAKEKYLPDPRRLAGGLISQGMSGEQLVVSVERIEVVE